MQNIKWNGWAYPLDVHVSNHMQAHEDLLEYSTYVKFVVPVPAHKVEYLIDRINFTDVTLQDYIGLFRANTNNIREDFEATSSSLIEVNTYRLQSRSTVHNYNM